MSRTLALVKSGVVDNVILGEPAAFPSAMDVTDRFPCPGPGWAYDATTDVFTAPAIEPAPAPPPAPRHITRLAFRSRFTQSELVNMEIAALDVPTAVMADRQKAANLRVMLANLQAATYIDLDRPDTRAGVQQLETGGLIGAGRAAIILDATVSANERYVP